MEDWEIEELDIKPNDKKIRCENNNGEIEEVDCVYPATVMTAVFGKIYDAECQRKVIEYINKQQGLTLCIENILDDIEKEFGLGHILQFYYIQNRTINEMAKLTHKTPKRVYNLICAGLRRLRHPRFSRTLAKFMPLIDEEGNVSKQ